jgi:hypothetical protein
MWQNEISLGNAIREWMSGGGGLLRREGGREGRIEFGRESAGQLKVSRLEPHEAMQQNNILSGITIRAEGRKGDAEERRREGWVRNERESAGQSKAWHLETT